MFLEKMVLHVEFSLRKTIQNDIIFKLEFIIVDALLHIILYSNSV